MHKVNTEKQVVVSILQKSFNTNKSVNYVVKQDKKRKERLKVLMEYSYELCKAFGEVTLNKDQTACALILYPHHKKDNWFSIRQDILLAIRCIGLERVLKVLKREALIKRNHPDEPFCYLWFIGVAPLEQGKGKGTKMLTAIINNYDQQQLPIYLETSMSENIPWYEKMGFETYKTIDFTYKLSLMRRKLS